MELPSGPWQAEHMPSTSFFTSASWQKTGPERAPRRSIASLLRKSVTVSRQCEHEDAVAALRIDLVVAAGGDRHVLLAADHVRHRWSVDTGAAIKFPQLLAGLRVEGLEPAVGLAVEDHAAGGGEHAADERLRRLLLPRDLAGVE